MENPNLLDIDGYDNYKFDKVLNQIFGIKRNKYLKNNLYKDGSYSVRLFKNGKGIKYNIRQIVYMCNPIENNNLVDIPNYDDYKFDKVLLQVYNNRTNMYLKNSLCGGYYRVGLSKNGISEAFGIHKLVYMLNNPNEDLTGFQIDHIDGNPLNNNINNLRKCSHSDNQSNVKTQKNNKLGIKYISKNKFNTYTFKLVKNGIRYEKTFKRLEDAIVYRDIKVKEICGEYANLG